MGAEIWCDTRQHAGKHEIKNEWWASNGVSTSVRKLDFGDYGTEGSNCFVDTKRNIDELAQNLGREHGRFRREIYRANAAGCLLVILVETDEARSVDDVIGWVSEHCRRCNHYRRESCDPRDRSCMCMRHGTAKPLQGDVLAKQMRTMELTRAVRFEFVRPEESARRICEILGVSYEDEGRD